MRNGLRAATAISARRASSAGWAPLPVPLRILAPAHRLATTRILPPRLRDEYELSWTALREFALPIARPYPALRRPSRPRRRCAGPGTHVCVRCIGGGWLRGVSLRPGVSAVMPSGSISACCACRRSTCTACTPQPRSWSRSPGSCTTAVPLGSDCAGARRSPASNPAWGHGAAGGRPQGGAVQEAARSAPSAGAARSGRGAARRATPRRRSRKCRTRRRRR
jgi:hypothetical protein